MRTHGVHKKILKTLKFIETLGVILIAMPQIVNNLQCNGSDVNNNAVVPLVSMCDYC